MPDDVPEDPLIGPLIVQRAQRRVTRVVDVSGVELVFSRHGCRETVWLSEDEANVLAARLVALGYGPAVKGSA